MHLNAYASALSRLGDKAGTAGAIIAAMGCASCFPAIASLGAALGLSFLGRFEGVFINTLLPVFAAVVLLANAIAGSVHGKVGRLTLGFSGPSMVLAALYPFWAYEWSTYLFYTGLGLMLAVAVWDLVSPPHRTCTATPIERGHRSENDH